VPKATHLDGGEALLPQSQSQFGGTGYSGNGSTSTEAMLAPYNIGEYVNADFIFIGTTTGTEPVMVDYTPEGEEDHKLYTREKTILTVKVDKVYFGDAFKAGDSVALYCPSANDNPFSNGARLEVGQRDVFFAFSYGDGLRTMLKDNKTDQYGFDSKTDLFLTDEYYSMLPFDADGNVAALWEWEQEAKPSMLMTLGQQEKHNRSFSARPDDQMPYRVFYTETDFEQALRQLRGKYPPGSFERSWWNR
jgi:hypothetical protein